MDDASIAAPGENSSVSLRKETFDAAPRAHYNYHRFLNGAACFRAASVDDIERKDLRMRLHLVGVLAVAVLLGSSAWLQAEEPNVADLAKELTGEKPAAERTPEQLEAAYVKVLDSLMPDMGNEDAGKRNGAQSSLERIAFQASRPGLDANRTACAKALAGKLGADVPALARAWILRQIERIGRAEVVPQVAKVLTDTDALVRESARRALQKNSSKEADDALQKAVAAATDPVWHVALLNALAQRFDVANQALFLKDAKSDNDDIRSAAVVGLAKTGDKSGAPAIAAAMDKGSPAAKRTAIDSYLLLADALVAKDDKATALGLYKKMLTAGGQVKCAAIIGVGRAGTVADLPTLFEALGDQDVRLRGSAVEALTLMDGKDVTAAIAAKAKTAGPEMKPALLQALARRADKSTAPIFVAAADDADDAVKVEALRGLGVVGDASAVPLLLKVAATTGKPQEIARESLGRVKGEDVDKALLTAMDEKDPKVKVEVVHALAMRHVTAATPALLKAAEDTDAGVRNEAFKALGAAGGTDSLAAVSALLAKTQDDGSRGEAAKALVNIARRDADTEKRAEPILAAMTSATGPAKFSLMGVLGLIGGQKSLEAIRAAVKDTDEKTKDAAIRALADWPDAAAAADLLDVAKTAANEAHQVLAIRGYIRVVRLPSGRPGPENAKMLAAGLETAKRAEEKKQALGGLAECRELAALQAVMPCLDDAALKEEASQAAVRIGRDIWNNDKNAETVKTAMEKVIEVSKNQDMQKQAKETLGNAEKKAKAAAEKK